MNIFKKTINILLIVGLFNSHQSTALLFEGVVGGIAGICYLIVNRLLDKPRKSGTAAVPPRTEQITHAVSQQTVKTDIVNLEPMVQQAVAKAFKKREASIHSAMAKQNAQQLSKTLETHRAEIIKEILVKIKEKYHLLKHANQAWRDTMRDQVIQSVMKHCDSTKKMGELSLGLAMQEGRSKALYEYLTGLSERVGKVAHELNLQQQTLEKERQDRANAVSALTTQQQQLLDTIHKEAASLIAKGCEDALQQIRAQQSNARSSIVEVQPICASVQQLEDEIEARQKLEEELKLLIESSSRNTKTEINGHTASTIAALALRLTNEIREQNAARAKLELEFQSELKRRTVQEHQTREQLQKQLDQAAEQTKKDLEAFAKLREPRAKSPVTQKSVRFDSSAKSSAEQPHGSSVSNPVTHARLTALEQQMRDQKAKDDKEKEHNDDRLRKLETASIQHQQTHDRHDAALKDFGTKLDTEATERVGQFGQVVAQVTQLEMIQQQSQDRQNALEKTQTDLKAQHAALQHNHNALAQTVGQHAATLGQFSQLYLSKKDFDEHTAEYQRYKQEHAQSILQLKNQLLGLNFTQILETYGKRIKDLETNKVCDDCIPKYIHRMHGQNFLKVQRAVDARHAEEAQRNRKLRSGSSQTPSHTRTKAFTRPSSITGSPAALAAMTQLSFSTPSSPALSALSLKSDDIDNERFGSLVAPLNGSSSSSRIILPGAAASTPSSPASSIVSSTASSVSPTPPTATALELLSASSSGSSHAATSVHQAPSLGGHATAAGNQPLQLQPSGRGIPSSRGVSAAARARGRGATHIQGGRGAPSSAPKRVAFGSTVSR